MLRAFQAGSATAGVARSDRNKRGEHQNGMEAYLKRWMLRLALVGTVLTVGVVGRAQESEVPAASSSKALTQDEAVERARAILDAEWDL